MVTGYISNLEFRSELNNSRLMSRIIIDGIMEQNQYPMGSGMPKDFSLYSGSCLVIEREEDGRFGVCLSDGIQKKREFRTTTILEALEIAQEYFEITFGVS